MATEKVFKLKGLNKDGTTFTEILAEKWKDRDWYQPIAGQPVGIGVTLIPTGVSTQGAKGNTVCYLDGNQPDAHIEVLGEVVQ